MEPDRTHWVKSTHLVATEHRDRARLSFRSVREFLHDLRQNAHARRPIRQSTQLKSRQSTSESASAARGAPFVARAVQTRTITRKVEMRSAIVG